ncbi:RNA polymerase sigma factor [Spirosoma endophyticum]|uniref:RNA polymerase sigma-70 factor, ECF subfamily n=1 Tax=Spirosoma endophyticum TaxID=662367 RepID=A0A1I1MUY7_9BACT|nr:hypothetical protein [Spirosoma endophyticum]SFC89191.1 RNA polymerase sigma-70 factor, ECF subfamily [Spirosoma endophyticum]
MKLKPLSDEIVPIRLHIGDEVASQKIYQRYWKKLYNIARHKIDSKDRVEELVLNIFLKIWERRSECCINWLDACPFTTVHYATLMGP